MTRFRFLFNVIIHSKNNNYRTKKNGEYIEIPRHSKMGKFLFIWLRVIPGAINLTVALMILFFGNDIVKMYSEFFSIPNISIPHHVVALLIPVFLIISVVTILTSFFIPNEYKQLINIKWDQYRATINHCCTFIPLSIHLIPHNLITFPTQS